MSLTRRQEYETLRDSMPEVFTGVSPTIDSCSVDESDQKSSTNLNMPSERLLMTATSPPLDDDPLPTSELFQKPLASKLSLADALNGPEEYPEMIKMHLDLKVGAPESAKRCGNLCKRL